MMIMTTMTVMKTVEGDPPAEHVHTHRFLIHHILGADHIAKRLAHLVSILVERESVHKESP